MDFCFLLPTGLLETGFACSGVLEEEGNESAVLEDEDDMVKEDGMDTEVIKGVISAGEVKIGGRPQGASSDIRTELAEDDEEETDIFVPAAACVDVGDPDKSGCVPVECCMVGVCSGEPDSGMKVTEVLSPPMLLEDRVVGLLALCWFMEVVRVVTKEEMDEVRSVGDIMQLLT